MPRKSTFSRYFKQADLFPQDVSFRENGGDAFTSMFGACTSLIIALVVLLYGVNKFSVLINYEDTRINEFTERNGIGEETIG